MKNEKGLIFKNLKRFQVPTYFSELTCPARQVDNDFDFFSKIHLPGQAG